MIMEKGEKRWMKAAEVADYLSVHRVTVYRMLYAHRLSGLKIKGVGWRIDRKRLDNWMEGEMEERERKRRRIIDWR